MNKSCKKVTKIYKELSVKKYCIYSDKEIDENKMSKEHIIPKKNGRTVGFWY